VAELATGFWFGVEVAVTWNAIDIELLGAIDPIVIPVLGSSPMCVLPLIVTLFGMKVVPSGIRSVKVILVA
ncbi:hypothetical protein ABE42_11055, partial [Bacillus thuringiensis]|nr:hypothetical protein [Bacillus thuringiensis]